MDSQSLAVLCRSDLERPRGYPPSLSSSTPLPHSKSISRVFPPHFFIYIWPLSSDRWLPWTLYPSHLADRTFVGVVLSRCSDCNGDRNPPGRPKGLRSVTWALQASPALPPVGYLPPLFSITYGRLPGIHAHQPMRRYELYLESSLAIKGERTHSSGLILCHHRGDQLLRGWDQGRHFGTEFIVACRIQ